MKFVWVIMVAVLLGGSGWIVNHALSAKQDQIAAEQRTQSALKQIERQIRIMAGSNGAELNGRGWPITIDPAWFGTDVPKNALLTGARPWLEVASPDEKALTHPVVRQAVNRDVAAFWYNPSNGIVRARAGVMVSDKAAIEAYNRVNSSSITTLVYVDVDATKD